MKTRVERFAGHRLIHLAFAWLVAAGLFAGCGTPADTECKTSHDCGGGDRVCEAGRCVNLDADTSSGQGSTSSGGGGMQNAGGDACMRFVACAFQVAPAEASSTAAAYGPDGACWMTQTQDACLKACTTGLDALHQTSPSVAECALCQSNADCSGATPACDAALGECVGCTSDANCGDVQNPHCDLATHQCGPAPCVPKGCGAVQCGFIDDGCGGPIDCGGCEDGNLCTSDDCNAGKCEHAPEPDLSDCAWGAVCLKGACLAVHASCIAYNPPSFTYYVNPDPQNMTGWDVGDKCICNGNMLETLYSGDVPEITVACSQCIQDGPGDRYCLE